MIVSICLISCKTEELGGLIDSLKQTVSEMEDVGLELPQTYSIHGVLFSYLV